MTFTPEEITAMAKEAGATKFYQERQSISQDNYLVGQAFLERFAALVAAKERERFALGCIDLVAFHGGSVELEAAIRARGQKEGV